ncbi:hypothetical protein REMIM1_PE00582 (plasmid) [Rhizobium etli bv. mimosae str. Mim1]|nr:hypothetical protein REMIM1_PE00582 [Rhizobium etli bv. mimosae str. Mim1]
MGRTWADLLAGLPLWVLSVSAAAFVVILVFSVMFADRPYSLGFLGTFGPPAASDNAQTTALKADLLKWSDDPPVVGNTVGSGDAKPATICPSGYYVSGPTFCRPVKFPDFPIR